MIIPRDDRVPVALIVAVWLLSTALWLRPGITRPDGVGYFAWLPSAVADRDLVLYDEWAHFGMLPNGAALSESPTPNGHLGNHWSVGSAVAWAPAYLLFAGTPWTANAACVAASAFFGLVALLAGYFAARRLFPRDAALIATIAMWFGSPLLWYSEREALMAHAAGAAACALVVFASMRGNRNAAALLSGIAFAIRPQNGIFLAVPFIVRKDSVRGSLSSVLLFVAGALPQLVVSQFLYGSPLPIFDLDPRNAQRPWHAFERFRGAEVLLSWFHGLVPWTPLLLAGIIGLVFLLRADRRLGIAAIAMFALQWLINATGDRVFWGGVSFGQRRFDNCTIVFLLGCAALFARLPRWMSIVIAAATSAWTMALFFAAQAVDLNRYVAPAELFDAFLRAPKRIGFLIDVPPNFKSTIALVAIGVFAVYAVIAATVRARPVAAGAIVCLVAAAWLAYCGTRDAAVLERWRPVIERSRAYGGSERDHRAALAIEADWLRRR